MRFTIGLRWRAVKGVVRKNPVFLPKIGFFYFLPTGRGPLAF
jgi:hypothetical protein